MLTLVLDRFVITAILFILIFTDVPQAILPSPWKPQPCASHLNSLKPRGKKYPSITVCQNIQASPLLICLFLPSLICHLIMLAFAFAFCLWLENSLSRQATETHFNSQVSCPPLTKTRPSHEKNSRKQTMTTYGKRATHNKKKSEKSPLNNKQRISPEI
ncbi:hypothetical protein V8C34DRAFT_276880 [Trichoderma compactum]